MKRESKIGLTLVFGILGLYLFVAWVKGVHMFAPNAKQYTIEFDNVAGLKTGDPVAVFGLPSGKVNAIRLGNAGAEVEINLDEAVNLHADCYAEIQIKELTGGKKVEIFPGTTGAILPDKARLSGKASMDFSTAFSKFGGFMEGISPASMDSLFNSIREITGAVASLTSEINTGQLSGTVNNLSGAADKLNRLLTRVEGRNMIDKVDSALTSLDAMAGKADGALTDIAAVSQQVNTNTLPKTDSILTNMSQILVRTEGVMVSVEELLTQMQDKETVIGKLFYDNETAEDLDKTLDNLNKTLDHIRNKRIHVSMSLSGKQKLYKEESKKIQK